MEKKGVMVSRLDTFQLFTGTGGEGGLGSRLAEMESGE